METGSIGASDAATLALLYGGGGGYGRGGGIGVGYGGGGGYGGSMLHAGNSVLAAEAHADGSGRGENIKANRDFSTIGFNSITSDNRESRIQDSFRDLFRNNADDSRRNDDKFAEVERRSDDRTAAVLGQINDHRAESTNSIHRAEVSSLKNHCEVKEKIAECCCETQKLIVSSETRLTERLLNQTIAEQASKLDAAQGNTNTNAILGAINGLAQAIANDNGHGRG
ncbi:hypothetical protein KAR91_55855 [Candidatus Pacearchaeota archaeon]|nr:hypothetical protein [Candidatus Pacearchaeota archaeon]